MSDSLLNLLQVLNEVLEEQGLQEQESGGAPTIANMTEEKLKSELIKLINVRYNQRYEEIIEHINNNQENYNQEEASPTDNP